MTLNELLRKMKKLKNYPVKLIVELSQSTRKSYYHTSFQPINCKHTQKTDIMQKIIYTHIRFTMTTSCTGHT